MIHMSERKPPKSNPIRDSKNRIKLGVFGTNGNGAAFTFHHDRFKCSWDANVRLAQKAEQLGFESLWIPEHPVIPAAMADPGRIIAVEGRLWIEATDGVVAVDELVVPGGKPVTGEQYRNGNRDRTGPPELLPVLLGSRGVVT